MIKRQERMKVEWKKRKGSPRYFGFWWGCVWFAGKTFAAFHITRRKNSRNFKGDETATHKRVDYASLAAAKRELPVRAVACQLLNRGICATLAEATNEANALLGNKTSNAQKIAEVSLKLALAKV